MRKFWESGRRIAAGDRLVAFFVGLTLFGVALHWRSQWHSAKTQAVGLWVFLGSLSRKRVFYGGLHSWAMVDVAFYVPGKRCVSLSLHAPYYLHRTISGCDHAPLLCLLKAAKPQAVGVVGFVAGALSRKRVFYGGVLSWAIVDVAFYVPDKRCVSLSLHAPYYSIPTKWLPIEKSF